jgi:hypothetical protein
MFFYNLLNKKQENDINNLKLYNYLMKKFLFMQNLNIVNILLTI